MEEIFIRTGVERKKMLNELEVEFSELKDRIEKLRTEGLSDGFVDKLSKAQLLLIPIQIECMKTYRTVLEARIINLMDKEAE